MVILWRRWSEQPGYDVKLQLAILFFDLLVKFEDAPNFTSVDRSLMLADNFSSSVQGGWLLRGGILKKCLNLNTKLGLIKLGLRKPRQMEF